MNWVKNLPTERIWIDHFLAVLAGVMSVYSVCISVGLNQNAQVLASAVAIAGLAGFGLSLLLQDTKVQRGDGWFLAFFGFFGLSQTRNLNNALPDGPLPFAIIAAVMMAILLIVGAIFAWRDATLLFLSLPSLVLFGLVGTIDTWRPGLFMFCGMILCIALLYARVHQRTMVQWAKEGGADPKLLHRDVWRWQAGPEYAFAAAGTIILLSFLGAPVVQTSLTGVSDAVRVNVQNQIRPQNQNRSNNAGPNVDAPIGTGPVNLSDRVEAIVTIDRPRYLRRTAYDQYNRRGWSVSSRASQTGAFDFKAAENSDNFVRTTPLRPLLDVPTGEIIEYVFERQSSLSAIVPSPGSIMELSKSSLDLEKETPSDLRESLAGSLVQAGVGSNNTFSFLIRVPREEEILGDAKLPPEVNTTESSLYLNYPATRGLDLTDLRESTSSDYAKLLILKTRIASQSKYNTQAPATPAGEDPVEYFLTTSKEGYCDLFASAFVIEARRLGYPARYVTGYLMDSTQLGSDGKYIVRERHSHSWAEVYFEEYGWIPFDATEGAIDITPENTEEDNSIIGLIRAWFSENGRTLMMVGAGFGALTLFWFGRRMIQGAPAAVDPLRALRQQQSRFQRALEQTTGSPRRFSQTFREYIELHQDRLRPLQPEVGQALPILERAFYSPNPLPETDSLELDRLIAAIEPKAKLEQKVNKAEKKSKRAPA